MYALYPNFVTKMCKKCQKSLQNAFFYAKKFGEFKKKQYLCSVKCKITSFW